MSGASCAEEQMVSGSLRVDFIVFFPIVQPHHQPSRPRQAQGSHAAQRRSVGRDDPRVLQLRLPQCLPPRLHSSQSRLRRRSTLPPTMRHSELTEGYELVRGDQGFLEKAMLGDELRLCGCFRWRAAQSWVVFNLLMRAY